LAINEDVRHVIKGASSELDSVATTTQRQNISIDSVAKEVILSCGLIKDESGRFGQISLE
jgi:hypothetical protein